MKDRPILFSTPMVRALLAGTKTQTRRLMKAQPREHVVRMRPHHLDPMRWIDADGSNDESRCRYAVGDHLWVKESIRRDDYRETSRYIADGAPTRADAWPWKVRSLAGRFMPIGLSRIALEVTAVRAQRLHDITPDDAEAEGIDSRAVHEKADVRRIVRCPLVDAYAALWDEINGDGAWDANPWIFAYTFRVLP